MLPTQARLPAVFVTAMALFVPASMSMVAANRTSGRGLAASACPSATTAISALQTKTGASLKHCLAVGRVITYNGVAVVVPAPGTGVSASADSTSGGVSMDVQTSANGVVTAVLDGAQPEAATADPQAATADPQAATAAATTTAAASTRDPACSMTAKSFRGWRWTPNKATYFLVNTAEGRPSNITAASFLSIQKVAAAHITNAYNNCGISFKPNIYVGYRATTSYNSNIRAANNSCGTPDARNVLDFGGLSGSLLALNCTWYQTVRGGVSRIVESDTRFDNSGRSWVTRLSGCSGARYDLLSVATHEMGHWVGMGHVADSGTRDLTMSTSIAPCNNSAQTLGRGDIAALNVAY
jgi:hypothetical protein